jgi:hypothetical protein
MFHLLILIVLIVCSMGAHMLAHYHIMVLRSDYDEYIDVDTTVVYTQSAAWLVSAICGLLWMRFALKYQHVRHSVRDNTIHMGKGSDKIIFNMYVYFMFVCVWFVLITDEIEARDAIDVDESFWHTNLHVWVWGAVGFALLSIVWQVHTITKNVISARKQQLNIKVEKP